MKNQPIGIMKYVIIVTSWKEDQKSSKFEK